MEVIELVLIYRAIHWLNEYCDRSSAATICLMQCNTKSNVSICPIKFATMTNCSHVEALMRTTSMRFSTTASDHLYWNSLVMQTHCCSRWPIGWSPVNILDWKVLRSVLACAHSPRTNRGNPKGKGGLSLLSSVNTMTQQQQYLMSTTNLFLFYNLNSFLPWWKEENLTSVGVIQNV